MRFTNRSQNNSITFQFAGMQYDSESGLNHTDYRQYSSSEGRWLSPDPYLGSLSLDNPQSLNRYVYVLNNPLKSRDPKGLDGDCPGDTPVVAGFKIPDILDDLGMEPDGFDGESIISDGGCDVPPPPPPPGPPEIDPCAGKSADCLNQEAARSRAAAADLLGYLASLYPACVAALRTAGTNINAVQRANAAWPDLQSAGSANDINPSALAAMGVRESGFQNIYGDHGHGRGTFQIDDRAHPEITDKQAFNTQFATNWSAGQLNTNFNVLYSRFNFTEAQLAQATFASYNFGVGNIHGNPDRIDYGTAPGGREHPERGNYGSNTLAIETNCF